MTGQVLFLAMVLAAFGAFMLVLGSVSIWSQRQPRQPRPEPVKAAVRPHREAVAAAVRI